jgi:hypothetical protein
VKNKGLFAYTAKKGGIILHFAQFFVTLPAKSILNAFIGYEKNHSQSCDNVCGDDRRRGPAPGVGKKLRCQLAEVDDLDEKQA